MFFEAAFRKKRKAAFLGHCQDNNMDMRDEY